jgi:putative membrane protein
MATAGAPYDHQKESAMQRRTLLAVLITVGLGWWLGQSTVAQDQAATNPDTMFVHKASHAGLAEVQMGKMAMARAASAEVKAFGQRMVDDHTQANQELMTIAQAKHIPVAHTFDQKHQAVADKLAALHGTEFDHAYVAGQLADHEEAVSLFTREAKEGKDAELKAFAAKTLPTLQEHLQLARNMTMKQKKERAQ